ncbi:unnamed protein product [Symbiodinium sp. CCMP2456]|nr:unnamed protein product [Symbiodinium sp. CCMP2456]
MPRPLHRPEIELPIMVPRQKATLRSGGRLIPTPARARSITTARSEATGYTCEIETLTTLLEESVSQGDRQATHHAYANVPASRGSCEERGTLKSSLPTAQGPRNILRLAQCVGTRTFDLTGAQLRIGCTLDQVARLLNHDQNWLWPLPDGGSETLRTWCSDYPYSSWHTVAGHFEQVIVYTDGSFDGRTSSWAFHVIGRRTDTWCSLGWAGDTVQTDDTQATFLGAASHGALNGELSALFWCLSWLLSLPPGVQILIHSDCTTAIGLSEGCAGQYRGTDISCHCRAVMQALQARGDCDRIAVQHMKSHVGHAGNEIADQLAKACCRDSSPGTAWASHPITPFLRHQWLPWLWLFVDTVKCPQAWPTQLADSFIDQRGNPAPLPTTQECESMLGLHNSRKQDPQRGPLCAALTAVLLTVNVQSLHPGEDPSESDHALPPFRGRAALLREQFADRGVCVAALQETRAPRNETIQSRTHLRFCSACDHQGSYGTEIWFSKEIPFVKHSSAEVFFQVGDFLVVHWDPRVIAVRFARARMRILFVALHAPTNSSPERNQWWQNFRLLIGRLRQGAQVVLMGDFNLHLHHSQEGRVGDLTWHTATPPPQAFWTLLEDSELWIPSTFSCCHPGPSATWQSPGGTTESRLDYIAVPTTWQVATGHSAVLHELEWGQARIDHFALWMRTSASLCMEAPRTGRRMRLNTQAMGTVEGKEKIKKLCQALEPQPWALDVHRHAAYIENHFRRTLPLAFPAQRTQQRRSYFQPETWQLRNQRAWLRKRVHSASHFGKQFSIIFALRSWKCSCRLWQPCHRLWSRWLRSLRELPGHLTALRATSKQLRVRIREDTQAYIHEVAVQATSATTKDTVQKLRALTGGPKRKQRGPSPLPSIEVSPGRLALTHQESKEKWISHFSAIEDGHVTDPVAFVHACYRRQEEKDLSGYSVSPDDVPNLVELEATLRAANTERAYGLDGIPGEVLHYGAPFLSKVAYQLLLKSAFRLCEPIQHKGGTLYFIWKHKGPKQSCNSYRGILVSSVLGKALHKTVRRRCTSALAQSAVPLQVGGLPQYPVTMPAHAARLFQSACHSRKLSHSLLFLDLQEAFYRIVRPLITGDRPSDEEVARLCSAVQLPPNTMHELHAFLGGPSLAKEAGSSEWADGAVAESLQDTWFRLPDEPEVVVTRTGSRPGDSLSDLVFSFLFAKVLRQVRGALIDSALLARIPWSREMHCRLEPMEHPTTQEIGLSDSTWMDDLSMFLTAPDAPSLVRALDFGASSLIDACLQRALVPNLAKGKTEAIMQLHGKGAKGTRKQIFGDAQGEIPLSCRLWDGARLRVVPVYKHLGGFLQHNGGLRHEISFRCAQAWEAFNRRRKKVFRSTLVSDTDKALLFDSLVSTVLFHGAGTWTGVTSAHIDSIDAVLRQMACQMLTPRYTCEEAWHLGTAQAIAAAHIPRASTYLHVSRLRYLLSCIRLDVQEIWALAHWEQGWLALVRSSVQWLWELSRNSGKELDFPSSWQCWVAECRSSPGKWKARVRRAMQAALDREARQAVQERHIWLLTKQLCRLGARFRLPPSRSRGCQQVCAPCQLAFQDLRAWSVHAFKCHGRKDEGKECNQRLELAAALRRKNTFSAPDGHLDDEMCRPSAEVLDCLAQMDFDGRLAAISEEEMWDRIRASLSCVCLPVQRLRVTLDVWEFGGGMQTLSQSHGLLTRLRHALEWLRGTDLVSVLVPDLCEDPAPCPTVGHLCDADMLLVRLPCPDAWTRDHVLVAVGSLPDSRVLEAYGRAPLLYSHEDSLRGLDSGVLPDFLEEVDRGCGFYLDLLGLRIPLPADIVPAKKANIVAQSIRLAGDISRLAVRLWTQGIRALLRVPDYGNADIEALLRIPGVHHIRQEGSVAIWAGQSDDSADLFHLS